MENLLTPWSNMPQRWGHPWHTMCSYLGSFPASLARSFICMLSNKGDIILDPFSGRGTTLLEARLTGRVPLASDLNPIAIALTKAKNVDINLNEIHERINRLEENFDLALYLPEAIVQEDKFLLIYHPNILAKLCYLREHLINSTDNVDEFLVGIILGIMHGAERQDGTSCYASISMPNTFSMSPDYVRRFVQNNHLQRVDRDIFSLIREKVNKMLNIGHEFLTKGIVDAVDAKSLTSSQSIGKYVGKVNLLFTSPPYLNIVNYARQNWIRLWFLKQDPELVSDILDDDLPLNSSLDFLEQFVFDAKNMLSENGIMVLVLGDVARSSNNVVSPARDLIRRLYEKKIFKYYGCISDHIKDNTKTTRIWKDTKGKATLIDRIIILSDSKPKFNTTDLANVFGEKGNVFDNFTIDTNAIEDNAYIYAGL